MSSKVFTFKMMAAPQRVLRLHSGISWLRVTRVHIYRRWLCWWRCTQEWLDVGQAAVWKPGGEALLQFNFCLKIPHKERKWTSTPSWILHTTCSHSVVVIQCKSPVPPLKESLMRALLFGYVAADSLAFEWSETVAAKKGCREGDETGWRGVKGGGGGGICLCFLRTRVSECVCVCVCVSAVTRGRAELVLHHQTSNMKHQPAMKWPGNPPVGPARTRSHASTPVVDHLPVLLGANGCARVWWGAAPAAALHWFLHQEIGFFFSHIISDHSFLPTVRITGWFHRSHPFNCFYGNSVVGLPFEPRISWGPCTHGPATLSVLVKS